MILVVDIGNSRIKWAYATGQGLVDPGEIPHEGLAATALQAFDQGAPADVERILAVNVAGEAIGSAFTMHAERRWGLTPQFAATAREAHGVRCGYADPSRLGADRWVALIAAYRLAGGAACVIDAGTAVTLDAVDVRGRHLGGLILAGPKVVAAALDRRTSGIGERAGNRGRDVVSTCLVSVRMKRLQRGPCWVLRGRWTARSRLWQRIWACSRRSTSPAVTRWHCRSGWKPGANTAATWYLRDWLALRRHTGSRRGGGQTSNPG